MTRKLWLLLIALLASGMVAVGCGDDDDEDEGSDEPAQEQTDTGGGEAEEEDSDAGDAGDTEIPEETRQQAADACQQGIDSNPALEADLKAELQELCDGIAEAETAEEIAEITKESCVKIAESVVPEGASRDQAIEACEAADVTP